MVRTTPTSALLMCCLLQAMPGGGAREDETDLLLAATSSSSLFELYSQHHHAAMEEARTNPRAARVLVCQPLYGLANRLRAMMSCFVIALATNRIMFVDWEHQHTKFYEKEIRDMPGGQPARLGDLLETPGFAWDAQDARGLISERMSSGKVLHLADDVERDETLLCRNISSALSQYDVVTLKTYFWWELALHNPLYEEKFARIAGRDEIGVINIWKELGPRLFRPVKDVRVMMSGLDLH